MSSKMLFVSATSLTRCVNFKNLALYPNSFAHFQSKSRKWHFGHAYFFKINTSVT